MSNEVFHEGERRVQRRAGETTEADRNSPMIGTRIPVGAIPFLQQQSLLVFAVRKEDDLWCLPACGEAGWISASPHAISLDLDRAAGPLDERVLDAAEHAQSVGCVALDFATRRRLRINGRLEKGSANSLVLTVAEAFPNCPKYITQRKLVWSDVTTQSRPGAGKLLTRAHREIMRQTDIFFIATQHPDRGLDASHRGGNPGFVEAVGEDTLRFPDYPGNSMFNTLGNLEIDSAAGLLIPDFTAGMALALTGRASVSYENLGRTRLVTVKVRRWMEVPLPVTDTARELSPFNPASSGLIDGMR